jgi:hypothetical protein
MAINLTKGQRIEIGLSTDKYLDTLIEIDKIDVRWKTVR